MPLEGSKSSGFTGKIKHLGARALTTLALALPIGACSAPQNGQDQEHNDKPNICIETAKQLNAKLQDVYLRYAYWQKNGEYVWERERAVNVSIKRDFDELKTLRDKKQQNCKDPKVANTPEAKDLDQRMKIFLDLLPRF